MRIFADCPKCQSNLSYKDGNHFVCAECAHEWPLEGASATVIAVASVPPRSSSKALISALKSRRMLWRGRKSAAHSPAHGPIAAQALLLGILGNEAGSH